MATYIDRSTGRRYSSFRDLERDALARTGRTAQTAGTNSTESQRAEDRRQENEDIQRQRSSPTQKREEEAARERRDRDRKSPQDRAREATDNFVRNPTRENWDAAVKAMAAATGQGEAQAAQQLGANSSVLDAISRMNLGGNQPITTQPSIPGQNPILGQQTPDLSAIPAPEGLPTDFLKTLFGDVPTDFDLGNLRPESETALGAIRRAFNLSGMAPFLESTIRNRAASSLPLFQLGAALGNFGAPGFADGELQLGGQNYNELVQNAALGGVSKFLPTSNFIDLLSQGFGAMGAGGDRAARAREALGITGSESATTAFAPIATNFLNPRLRMLPQGLRGIVGSGIGEQLESYLGGKSSAEINPADFFRYLQSSGVLF